MNNTNKRDTMNKEVKCSCGSQEFYQNTKTTIFYSGRKIDEDNVAQLEYTNEQDETSDCNFYCVKCNKALADEMDESLDYIIFLS